MNQHRATSATVPFAAATLLSVTQLNPAEARCQLLGRPPKEAIPDLNVMSRSAKAFCHDSLAVPEPDA